MIMFITRIGLLDWIWNYYYYLFPWKFWIITVTMSVCILFLWWPEQDGQGLRLEVALRLALPCVFLQILVTLLRPEQDEQRHELENWKVEYELKPLEPLHLRMNSLLVCNLYNALYEVYDVYLFMFLGTCYDFVIQQLAGWLQVELEEWELNIITLVEQSDTLDYCYMLNEHKFIFQVLLPCRH